jgi:hypothetical protein
MWSIEQEWYLAEGGPYKLHLLSYVAVSVSEWKNFMWKSPFIISDLYNKKLNRYDEIC